jgi:hypothetical protein
VLGNFKVTAAEPSTLTLAPLLVPSESVTLNALGVVHLAALPVVFKSRLVQGVGTPAEK